MQDRCLKPKELKKRKNIIYQSDNYCLKFVPKQPDMEKHDLLGCHKNVLIFHRKK